MRLVGFPKDEVEKEKKAGGEHGSLRSTEDRFAGGIAISCEARGRSAFASQKIAAFSVNGRVD